MTDEELVQRYRLRWGEIPTTRRRVFAAQLRGPGSGSPMRSPLHYERALAELAGRDRGLLSLEPSRARDLALIAYTARARAPKVDDAAKEHIHLRVTRAQKDEIADAAQASGENVTEYLLRLHDDHWSDDGE